MMPWLMLIRPNGAFHKRTAYVSVGKGEMASNFAWVIVPVAHLGYFLFGTGQQPDLEREDSAGQLPGGSLWERVHCHQRQLQPLWKISGNDIYPNRSCDGGKNFWISPRKVQSYKTGSVGALIYYSGLSLQYKCGAMYAGKFMSLFFTPVLTFPLASFRTRNYSQDSKGQNTWHCGGAMYNLTPLETFRKNFFKLNLSIKIKACLSD